MKHTKAYTLLAVLFAVWLISAPWAHAEDGASGGGCKPHDPNCELVNSKKTTLEADMPNNPEKGCATCRQHWAHDNGCDGPGQPACIYPDGIADKSHTKKSGTSE